VTALKELGSSPSAHSPAFGLPEKSKSRAAKRPTLQNVRAEKQEASDMSTKVETKQA